MMDEALRDIDFTGLQLDSATRELMQRLLNCIETFIADLHAAQAEIQRLRDEIARLKDEKGRPRSDTGSEQSSPRKERIPVDREEVVKLDRTQLPLDVKPRGYPIPSPIFDKGHLNPVCSGDFGTETTGYCVSHHRLGFWRRYWIKGKK